MKLKIMARKIVDGFNWRYKVPEPNEPFQKRVNKFMATVNVKNTCVEGNDVYIFYTNRGR